MVPHFNHPPAQGSTDPPPTSTEVQPMHLWMTHTATKMVVL